VHYRLYQHPLRTAYLLGASAYALIITTFSGAPLSSITGGLLWALLLAFGVHQVRSWFHRHVEIAASELIIDQHGVKTKVPYDAITKVRLNGNTITLTFIGRDRWPVFQRAEKERSRTLRLERPEEFASNLQIRLPSPDLLTRDDAPFAPLPTTGQRVLAHTIDLIVVSVLWFGSWLAVATLAAEVDPDSRTLTVLSLAVFFSAPLYWFVYHWLLTSVSRTAGKRLTSLRIETESGSPTPGLATAFKRTALLTAAIVPLGLGVWLPLLRGTPFWHDKATRTHVVRTPGPQRISAPMTTADSPTN